MPSNLARKSARRKQQTRLAFDPVDPDLRSSSPANMPPAKVRYKLPNLRSPPSSSRPSYTVDDSAEGEDELASRKESLGVNRMSKMANLNGRQKKNGKLPLKALRTPVKSSQIMPKGMAALDIESDEDDLEAGNTAGQQKPPFAHQPSSTIFSSASRRTRPAVDLDDSDGSPPEDEIQTPSKKKVKGKEKAVSLSPKYDSDEVEGALPQRATRSTKAYLSASKPAKKGRGNKETYIELSSDSDNELVLPVSKKSKKGKAKAPAKEKALVDEDEDSDNPRPATSSARYRRPTFQDDYESEKDRPAIGKNAKSNRQAINIESDSDDEMIRSSRPRRRATAAVPEDAEDDSDEEPITSPLKGRKRRQPNADLDNSDIPSSPRKRRRPASDNDEDEESDLPPIRQILSKGKGRATSESSRNESTPIRITRQATGRKHRTAKEKQMELLKRKRAGEDIDELTDSSEASSELKRGVYDTDSELEMLSTFEDESEPEEREKPRRKPSKKAHTDSYDLPEDSDFVVDDDEGLIGVPLGLMDIPLQFRHAAHKPLKEHFKDAVEWMVHRKINPAFSRDDDIYLQCFRKLDDEYQGYAKSKFASSQWTAEFTKVLYARPDFITRGCVEGEGYTVDGVPKCDVCNHRKHIPKFAIHFEGKAYHKSTLEEVEHDSEEESDDDDVRSVDSKGHSLPDEDKEWFSGRFCHENAQQAHALIHWKYHLNTWVEAQLESEGYLSPEKLAEREKMKAKQRRNYANNLVDEWENHGIIKDLYRDFKGQLEAARASKQGRWERGQFKGFGGGGGDD